MPQNFVIVDVGERRRVLRLADLREIVPLLSLVEVDGRAGLCRGMANLRGEMVPVFDLAGPQARLSPSRMILVTQAQGEPVGLLVDDVEDVVTVPDEDVATRPVGGGRTSMVVRIGEEILSVLMPEEALRDER